MGAYADALMRYFDLFGRSSRSQYWLFQLFYALLFLLAAVIDIWAMFQIPGYPRGILIVFMAVFHIVPQITVSVRRLHDIGRSGFWYLIAFVPFGGFLLLFWACVGSDPGPNDYGDDPRNGSPPVRRREVQPSSGRPTRSADYANETIARMQMRQSAARGQFSGQ